MDNVFSDLEQMVEALTGPLGDYAPRRRHLMVDYKNKAGTDFHQEVLVFHPNGATDESLVQSIKEQLPGLTLPPNIGETLDNAGIHPVNLEELKHGR